MSWCCFREGSGSWVWVLFWGDVIGRRKSFIFLPHLICFFEFEWKKMMDFFWNFHDMFCYLFVFVKIFVVWKKRLDLGWIKLKHGFQIWFLENLLMRMNFFFSSKANSKKARWGRDSLIHITDAEKHQEASRYGKAVKWDDWIANSFSFFSVYLSFCIRSRLKHNTQMIRLLHIHIENTQNLSSSSLLSVIIADFDLKFRLVSELWWSKQKTEYKLYTISKRRDIKIHSWHIPNPSIVFVFLFPLHSQIRHVRW